MPTGAKTEAEADAEADADSPKNRKKITTNLDLPIDIYDKSWYTVIVIEGLQAPFQATADTVSIIKRRYRTMTTTKRTPKYETIHEHVNSVKEAWRIADSYFPTDYELVRSEPYPIWKSTSTVRENAFYCQIADLCVRLEVTVVEDNWDTTVINIWIDDDEPETMETETETATSETTSDESDENDSESTTDAKADEPESRNSGDGDRVMIQLDRLSVCDLMLACTEIVIGCKMEMTSDATDKITEYRRAHVLPDTIKKWQRLHDAVEKQLDEHDKKHGIDW